MRTYGWGGQLDVSHMMYYPRDGESSIAKMFFSLSLKSRLEERVHRNFIPRLQESKRESQQNKKLKILGPSGAFYFLSAGSPKIKQTLSFT